jgi:hypothetical protein
MKVERGAPKVIGPDPGAPGLLLIDVPLEPPPDAGWAQIFGGTHAFDAPPGLSMSVGMHSPELRGGVVRLRAPDAEVERYLASLDERIDAANAEYERSVAPELERRQREEERARDEERRRVEDAQGRLDDLA